MECPVANLRCPTWDAPIGKQVDVWPRTNLVCDAFGIDGFRHDLRHNLAHALVYQRLARRRREAERDRGAGPVELELVRRSSANSQQACMECGMVTTAQQAKIG